jgi:hypothetical protein
VDFTKPSVTSEACPGRRFSTGCAAIFNAEMLRFADHYGFKPVACPLPGQDQRQSGTGCFLPPEQLLLRPLLP